MINILVVGECGDGKSTLVNGLRDSYKSAPAICGRNAQGVTKDIVLYPCHDIDGVPFNILDTPGVGDHQIRPAALISMIEEFLKAGMVPGGVRGVVVTTPVPDGRIRLGAQIVQVIVDKGLVAPAGENKYSNIILCGTKTDKADTEDKEAFMNEVRPLFFAKSAARTGPCIMVSHTDYTPLRKAIAKLPAMGIAYIKPAPHEMADALAEILGIRRELIQQEMEKMRQLVEEQSAQLKDVLVQMSEESNQHRKEMAKKDEMIQGILDEMRDLHCKTEAARLQREAELEQLRNELDDERRREQEEAARQQEILMIRWEQDHEMAEQEAARVREQQAAAEAQHRRRQHHLQDEHRREMADVRRSSSSSSGGSCLIL